MSRVCTGSTARRIRVVSGAITFALTVAVAPAAARAQATEPPRVVTPALDFSGVLFANFQRRTDSLSKAANGGNAASKFDVERVYLNFRMPAGNRASIRVTTDIFNGDQSGTSYYKGWTARLKYAYVQWNFANNVAGVEGLNATARFGMLHNVIIDHEDSFWPRYLSQNSVERSGGFFSSSDLGAATLVTLPSRRGEVYATVTNGPGYATAENDRFKDFAARLTLTPFANGELLGAWGKTLAVSPWFYSGRTASKFQNGGEGQVGGVSEGLKRNRHGVYVATRDPRLTIAVGYGSRTETIEGGANTAASPRTATDVSGRLLSGFVMVRPGAWSNPEGRAAKWGVLGRIDEFTPNTELDPSNRLTIASLFWEPTPRLTFSLDAQRLSRQGSSTINETNTLFFHVLTVF